MFGDAMFISIIVDGAAHLCTRFRNKVLKRIGEDWVFLTLLGVTMALLSFIMDYVIEKCQEGDILIIFNVHYGKLKLV